MEECFSFIQTVPSLAKHYIIILQLQNERWFMLFLLNLYGLHTLLRVTNKQFDRHLNLKFHPNSNRPLQ